MFITKKHISRRTMLRGMGATVALPFLESMVPAMTPMRRPRQQADHRLACLEIVHGAAGATRFGTEKNMWSPAAGGRDFDLSPTSMAPLESWKDYLTIISNTDMRPAEAFELPEVGGDHFRSSAVFLTQAHPKQTEGSDVYAGTSFDQIYANKFGQDTPLPSIQLSIESVDQAAAATTATPASTPTRSAGPHRPSRCRWSAIRAWCSINCSAPAARRRKEPSDARPIAASSIG